MAYPVSWLLAQVSTAISEAAKAPLISMAPILANCWALYKTMHAIVVKDIRSTIGYQISILSLAQDYLAECDKPECAIPPGKAETAVSAVGTKAF
ncbi:MAG: hypothetical protein WC588_03510 [Candidatus Micrarchaeia archaeon]